MIDSLQKAFGFIGIAIVLIMLYGALERLIESLRRINRSLEQIADTQQEWMVNGFDLAELDEEGDQDVDE